MIALDSERSEALEAVKSDINGTTTDPKEMIENQIVQPLFNNGTNAVDYHKHDDSIFAKCLDKGVKNITGAADEAGDITIEEYFDESEDSSE